MLLFEGFSSLKHPQPCFCGKTDILCNNYYLASSKYCISVQNGDLLDRKQWNIFTTPDPVRPSCSFRTNKWLDCLKKSFYETLNGLFEIFKYNTSVNRFLTVKQDSFLKENYRAKKTPFSLSCLLPITFFLSSNIPVFNNIAQVFLDI